MLFKEFFQKVISKKTGLPDDKNINPDKINTNDPFFKFAYEEFNKLSQLSETYITENPDQKITVFSEKFNILKKENKEKQIFENLACMLDQMAVNNLFWFVIPFDQLYVSDDNKFVFNWFELDKYTASDQKKILKEIKIKYQDLISTKLNSGIVKSKMLNLDLTKEAFILFFRKIIYPKLPSQFNLPPAKWLNIALTKMQMTPEEKYFFNDLFHNSSKFKTCTQIVNIFFTAKQESICMSQEIQNNIIWNFGFHTEHGRQKKSIQNEDSYTLISSSDQKSLLFMVADGVSTADIGRGKTVSAEIEQNIEDQKDVLIEFMHKNADLDSDIWIEKCREKIVSILKQINENCIHKLNQKLENIDNPEEKLPMSSTVILGFVNKNRAVFGHLGDSHVFYIHNNKIMRMNEEHNVLADRVSDYIDNKKKQPFKEDKTDKHLERVMPLIQYNDEQQKFLPIDLEEKITFMEFYPKEKSTIIAATDGLIDCLGSTKNDFENEEQILKAYLDALSESDDQKYIARSMARKADKNSGIDNITLIVLSNTFLSGNKEPKKVMKKLS